MKLKTTLSTSMTWSQFDNGYWYATELKEFAETLPSEAFRRQELETSNEG